MTAYKLASERFDQIAWNFTDTQTHRAQETKDQICGTRYIAYVANPVESLIIIKSRFVKSQQQQQQ